MPNIRERLQDLYERAWCQVWRWQYIAVTRLLPETAAEIRQGGYNEGFRRGEEHALQCRGYDDQRERELGKQIAKLSSDAENRPSGVASNA